MDFNVIVEAIKLGYELYPPEEDAAEKFHENAVGRGLAQTGLIESIWCSNMVIQGNEDEFLGITHMGKYGFDINLNVAKEYDLSILDLKERGRRDMLNRNKKIRSHDYPSWAFQLKRKCSENYACALALADLLWAFVDKLHAERKLNIHIEKIMVWAEHESHESNHILRMDDPNSTMKYVLEPSSFTKLKENDDDYSWSDSINRIIKPKSISFIKRGLAGQTGTSYYNQYRQRGALTITTEYQQFFVNGWNVYVHRILSGKLVGGGTASGTPITDILQWIP